MSKMKSKLPQSIGTHKLLTQKEEVEISIQVQDFIKLEQAHGQLIEELGRKPTLAEWAGRFDQPERVFLERVEKGSAVSPSPCCYNPLYLQRPKNEDCSTAQYAILQGRSVVPFLFWH